MQERSEIFRGVKSRKVECQIRPASGEKHNDTIRKGSVKRMGTSLYDVKGSITEPGGNGVTSGILGWESNPQ